MFSPIVPLYEFSALVCRYPGQFRLRSVPIAAVILMRRAKQPALSGVFTGAGKRSERKPSGGGRKPTRFVSVQICSETDAAVCSWPESRSKTACYVSPNAEQPGPDWSVETIFEKTRRSVLSAGQNRIDPKANADWGRFLTLWHGAAVGTKNSEPREAFGAPVRSKLAWITAVTDNTRNTQKASDPEETRRSAVDRSRVGASAYCSCQIGVEHCTVGGGSEVKSLAAFLRITGQFLLKYTPFRSVLQSQKNASTVVVVQLSR